MIWVASVLVLGVASAWAAPPARFFVEGDGRIALVNPKTDKRVNVRYRREDGSYDPEALAQIRRVFRSPGDDSEGKASLRLIEVLSYLQRAVGGQPLTLLSGYRNPTYNENLRAKGVKAAGGSLHTEGLAADVAFPRPKLHGLWLKVRELDCCGAGYYAKDGFMHVDVGRPRFWEPSTSRVEENLSAGNAKLFARTEFDRYGAGETIVVALHALTVPPVLVARKARLVGEADPVTVEADLPRRDDCYEAPASGVSLRVAGVHAGRRGRLVLATCEPRSERTPAEVETNPVEIR